MKNAFLLARKDSTSYLRSWLGAFVFFFFFLIAGIFFSVIVLSYAKISWNAARNAVENVHGLGLTRFIYSSFFLNIASVLIFMVPLMTMRSFAEEKRQGTLEFLFTYPLSDFEIVWGKFLGQVWFFELLLLPTAAYAALIYVFGGELDWRAVLMGYFGFWLLGNAYLALGVFVSSLCTNPALSAIVTFGCLVVFWILDWVVAVTDGRWALILAAISPLGRYREFTFGVFDMANTAYFLFFQLYFLFLALRSVETRNWKG